jgi:hypothetical protein
MRDGKQPDASVKRLILPKVIYSVLINAIVENGPNNPVILPGFDFVFCHQFGKIYLSITDCECIKMPRDIPKIMELQADIIQGYRAHSDFLGLPRRFGSGAASISVSEMVGAGIAPSSASFPP